MASDRLLFFPHFENLAYCLVIPEDGLNLHPHICRESSRFVSLLVVTESQLTVGGTLD